LRKTKTDYVTPAKAESRAKKLNSRFRGNDKCCFRYKNYLKSLKQNVCGIVDKQQAEYE